MLNESFNVVMVRVFEMVGEVVMIREVFEDGLRVFIVGRVDEEWVCELLDEMRFLCLRVGDLVLLDVCFGLFVEKLPCFEVEDLLLEEVFDIFYFDIGGFDI